MIYDLSLQTGGFIAGMALVVLSLPGLIKPGPVQIWLKRFPRSSVGGIVLPIGYVLVLRFVEEFLAVRALGILCLLAAEPLLEAAFFRYETTRLFLTVLAYLLIVAGLFWVTMPYLLRDQINWSAHSSTRWRTIHGIGAAYGLTILACAFTQY